MPGDPRPAAGARQLRRLAGLAAGAGAGGLRHLRGATPGHCGGLAKVGLRFADRSLCVTATAIEPSSMRCLPPDSYYATLALFRPRSRVTRLARG